MQPSRGIVLLTLVAALAATTLALASGVSAFDRVLGHYETVRQALLHDSTDGVADAAGGIEQELEALGTGFTAGAAGIRADGAGELRSLLPAMRAAAAGLRSATTIEDAREAFGALSKAMVRYRRLVAEPEPVVAFCPMAQQVWLQPEGEIGNPYYGQGMARCGEIVSE